MIGWGIAVRTIRDGSPKRFQVSVISEPAEPYSSFICIQPFIEIPPNERLMLLAKVSTRISSMASSPHMGGFQLWLMVDISVATAPVGWPLWVALNQASAKHVPLTKSPFTQATDQINGSMLSLVRAVTFEFEKPEVPHEVWLPCPV